MGAPKISKFVKNWGCPSGRHGAPISLSLKFSTEEHTTGSCTVACRNPPPRWVTGWLNIPKSVKFEVETNLKFEVSVCRQVTWSSGLSEIWYGRAHQVRFPMPNFPLICERRVSLEAPYFPKLSEIFGFWPRRDDMHAVPIMMNFGSKEQAIDAVFCEKSPTPGRWRDVGMRAQNLTICDM